MFISDKSDLDYLNFTSGVHHFQLGKVEWKNVVLNPMAREDSAIIDLSDSDLCEVLFNLYGELSLVENCLLFKACEEHSTLSEALDKNKMMSLFGRFWNERLSQLFDVMATLPVTFLTWAHEKKMGSKDLQPLLGYSHWDHGIELLEAFYTKNLSRNEGKQILDLLVDLLLLKKPIADLLPEEGVDWTQRLLKMRSPKAYSSLEEPKDEAWPRYVQVVNHRQGDRVLKKMQITYTNKEDLDLKLKRLTMAETRS